MTRTETRVDADGVKHVCILCGCEETEMVFDGQDWFCSECYDLTVVEDEEIARFELGLEM